MEREEIDAMWERIKALEGNSLKISKTLGEQSILSILGHMIDVSVTHEKVENFRAYMQPKAEKAVEYIKNAKNVDTVLQLVREFTNDCLKFTASLIK